MFNHPHFWRHFGAYVGGAACLLLGTVGAVAFPALAPVAAKLVYAGGGLLALGGTGVIEPRKRKDVPL
jgi:hypothetical protein